MILVVYNLCGQVKSLIRCLSRREKKEPVFKQALVSGNY